MSSTNRFAIFQEKSGPKSKSLLQAAKLKLAMLESKHMSPEDEEDCVVNAMCNLRYSLSDPHAPDYRWPTDVRRAYNALAKRRERLHYIQRNGLG